MRLFGLIAYLSFLSFYCYSAEQRISSSQENGEQHEKIKTAALYREISITAMEPRSFGPDRIGTLFAYDSSGTRIGQALIRLFAHSAGKTAELEYLRIFDGYEGRGAGTMFMHAMPRLFPTMNALYVVSTDMACDFYRKNGLRCDNTYADEFVWRPDVWKKRQEAFAFKELKAADGQSRQMRVIRKPAKLRTQG